MTRYILTVIFAIAVIGLYHFIDIRLFDFDLTRQTKNALFHLRGVQDIDPTVVLFNVGKLQPDELQEKIDSLLIASPMRIGINLCHWDKIPGNLVEKYKSDSRVIFANCQGEGLNSLSQIIGDQNTVTHFKTDKPDYFELQLTAFRGRGNQIERINYGPKLSFPFDKGELTDSYFWFNPDHLRGKTILLGYMGDYSTDSIYYHQSTRITPMNEYYGENSILPDMYDIEISANILSTINHKKFIDEINHVLRVLIILAFSLVNVTLLTFAKTRWTIVNFLIAAVLFFLLTVSGAFLLVYLFDQGYYLEMDELPLILLIATAFTVLMNIGEKRHSLQQVGNDKAMTKTHHYD